MRAGWLLAVLVGCTGEAGDCTALTDGTWTLDGTAIGMAMTATVTMDVEGCSFTFSEWSMAMVVPDGGVIDGATVTLTGDGFDDCTGEVAEDGTVEGACGDGGTFTMSPQ